ncbi:hypothetical protein G6F49_011081 [Rhizopus delemar]|uniref:Uncharacterized protein n=2 Tax=Rhizopus TaxID=4842 RepID=A0A9P6YVU6_9FUNG|nr:hypothetical protein G6F49_011081 [Rhizopus delemar]KAG1565120.1 hypothetical protein G6F50_010369 [Rhizopus delemar]
MLKRQPPKVNTKNIDFGKMALKILSSEIPAGKEEDRATSASNPSGSTTSNRTRSNRSMATVSPAFLDRFHTAYGNMIDEKKWILKIGKVVENEIFQHGLQCQFENFIIDPSDPLWKNRFTNDGIDEIRRHKPHTLPPCPDQLLNYLNHFSDIKTLDALISQTRKRHYDFDQAFDLEWAQSSIISALRLFQGNYFPLTDQTEADMIRRIWSFIDTAFDNVNLDIRCGEKESFASSYRRNRERSANDRKKHSHRTDLLFKCNEGELECAEVGKKDDGDNGTKELHELGLKCPKMMKDQLCHLIKVTPHHQYDLAIVGFVTMSLKLCVMVLDRPSTYVCRIQKTSALFFPSNVETMGARLEALLALVTQVKQGLIMK